MIANGVQFSSGNGKGSGGWHRRWRQARAEVSAPEGGVLRVGIAVVAAAVVEVERVAERVIPELPRGRHAPPPSGPAAAGVRPLPATAW